MQPNYTAQANPLSKYIPVMIKSSKVMTKLAKHIQQGFFQAYINTKRQL